MNELTSLTLPLTLAEFTDLSGKNFNSRNLLSLLNKHIRAHSLIVVLNMAE
jgi:hypothetical protein